jgi:hypothetical protein
MPAHPAVEYAAAGATIVATHGFNRDLQYDSRQDCYTITWPVSMGLRPSYLGTLATYAGRYVVDQMGLPSSPSADGTIVRRINAHWEMSKLGLQLAAAKLTDAHVDDSVSDIPVELHQTPDGSWAVTSPHVPERALPLDP